MPKSTAPSKSAPMVIPATRPRNPFGAGANMAKAGSHQKPTKAQRLLDNKAARDAAKANPSDDFSP